MTFSFDLRSLRRPRHEADGGRGRHQVGGEEGSVRRKGHQVCAEGRQEEMNLHAGRPAESRGSSSSSPAVFFSEAQISTQGLDYAD